MTWIEYAIAREFAKVDEKIQAGNATESDRRFADYLAGRVSEYRAGEYFKR